MKTQLKPNDIMDSPSVTLDFSGKSPMEIFEFFFDDETLSFIVEELKRYACQKGIEFTVSLQDMKIFFGILLLSGYQPLPSRRMYWTVHEDYRVAPVAQTMSRNRFEEILRFLHFNNYQRLDTTDKMTKLRPIMDRLNKKFVMVYPKEKQMDLDEAMIEYLGEHGCKQSIPNKPVRFGFKAWCLNSRLGYLTVFDIYQGSTYGSTNDYEKRFGKGGGTLLFLLDKLPLSIRSMPLKFYFDNYFTGLPQLNQLSLLNCGGKGTIRENRVPKDCSLKSTKIMKRGKRGAMDIAFDDNHNLALVR